MSPAEFAALIESRLEQRQRELHKEFEAEGRSFLGLDAGLAGHGGISSLGPRKRSRVAFRRLRGGRISMAQTGAVAGDDPGNVGAEEAVGAAVGRRRSGRR
jgi:hypothetical protein